MISVHAFVSMNHVWQRVTPTLEQMVRWANRHYVSYAEPVNRMSGRSHNALVAETAFFVAARGMQIADAEAAATRELTSLPGGGDAADPQLTPHGQGEVRAIAERISAYSSDNLVSPECLVRVPGCGAVNTSLVDILDGNHLIEVKSVDRSFRGGDFRQLLTYSAMFYARSKSIDKVTVLNPRLGRYVTLQLQDLASGSSGKGSVLLMQDLVLELGGVQVSGV